MGDRRATTNVPGRVKSPVAEAVSAATTRSLTPRQTELLRLLATGLTMRSAASAMHIAINTAYALRSDAFDRLNVSSSPEAWAALGWLEIPSADG